MKTNHTPTRMPQHRVSRASVRPNGLDTRIGAPVKRPSGGSRTKPSSFLQKAPTGITGFDDIASGGLPKGRPSLVCGGPGCGKSLFAVEFLVRGALEYGEPGVLMT